VASQMNPKKLDRSLAVTVFLHLFESGDSRQILFRKTDV